MAFVRKVKNKLGKVINVLCDPNDPTPVEIPADMKRPESQDERIRRIIREQIRPQDVGYETEGEAEDLEIEDDEVFADMPLTEEEFNYLKSKNSDIIEEVLEARTKKQKEVIKDDRKTNEDVINPSGNISDTKDKDEQK